MPHFAVSSGNRQLMTTKPGLPILCVMSITYGWHLPASWSEDAESAKVHALTSRLRCCRCDNVCGLSLPDIVKNGGGCCILAEHILTELAYKLGRAAKYGA